MSKAIIDSATFYLLTRRYGRSVHYGKFAEWLKSRFECDDLVLASVLRDDGSANFQNVRNMLESTRSLGWRPWTHISKKEQLPSPAAMIAAEMAESYCRDQDVILGYGGGDIRCVVDRAQTRGVPVLLLGEPRGVSGALRSVTGHVFDVRAHFDKFCK